MRLEEDLVWYPEIREQFAEFVRAREAADESICSLILNIDERFMSRLIMQETVQELESYEVGVILFYLPQFAKTREYEEFYQTSANTPCLSRCASTEHSIRAQAVCA